MIDIFCWIKNKTLFYIEFNHPGIIRKMPVILAKSNHMRSSDGNGFGDGINSGDTMSFVWSAKFRPHFNWIHLELLHEGHAESVNR